MNFKPGDKAIHIGAGSIPPNTVVEIIEVGPWSPGERVELRGQMPTLLDPADYKVRDATGEFYCLENRLRKPDTYDITSQEWYQRILRGERLEESA